MATSLPIGCLGSVMRLLDRMVIHFFLSSISGPTTDYYSFPLRSRPAKNKIPPSSAKYNSLFFYLPNSLYLTEGLTFMPLEKTPTARRTILPYFGDRRMLLFQPPISFWTSCLVLLFMKIGGRSSGG